MVSAGVGLSTQPDARQAAMEAALAARRALREGRPSLAVLFASPHHAERAEAVLDAVHEAAGPQALIGCVAEAVLGGGREVEGEPAVSVWLASLPGTVETFRTEFVQTGEGGAFVGFPDPGAGRVHLLISDPFTFPADALLRESDRQRPGSVFVGGMASGAGHLGETRLFLDGQVLDSGAVAARLHEGVAVRTLVSQGCRPVGPSYTVTKAEGNLVLELAGRPPMELLRELFAFVDDRDRELMSHGLHVGRVIDEYKADPGRGDYLIRGVIGADQRTGAIALGEAVSVGETIRFHVRDAESADVDLRHMLGALGGRAPAAVLLFTCNGRGSRLFSVPDHDAALVSKELGEPPLAGFFCAGEVGPVGGRNFLHGFTASLAVFYETS
jgi:small ligand-binding sensory domain FIST